MPPYLFSEMFQATCSQVLCFGVSTFSDYSRLLLQFSSVSTSGLEMSVSSSCKAAFCHQSVVAPILGSQDPEEPGNIGYKLWFKLVPTSGVDTYNIDIVCAWGQTPNILSIIMVNVQFFFLLQHVDVLWEWIKCKDGGYRDSGQVLVTSVVLKACYNGMIFPLQKKGGSKRHEHDTRQLVRDCDSISTGPCTYVVVAL